MYDSYTIPDNSSKSPINEGHAVWEFDGPLAGPEFGPGKDAGAEVDGSGIDNFDIRRLLRLGGQFGGEPLVQLIVGLLEDDGGALLIGVGQGGALHRNKPQFGPCQA